MKELIEKLVFEALGEASMCWSETQKGIFDSNKATEIGNRLTQAIQALSQSEWVSVEDRLPKNNVGVLVFIPIEDNHITSGMYDYDNKWVLLDDYRLIEDDKQITHWMPLPQQPKLNNHENN